MTPAPKSAGGVRRLNGGSPRPAGSTETFASEPPAPPVTGMLWHATHDRALGPLGRPPPGGTSENRSGKSVIPSLKENRTLGVERVRVDRDADLVPSRGVVLFRLKADPTFIDANATLIVENTNAGRKQPVDITLYVKTKS